MWLRNGLIAAFVLAGTVGAQETFDLTPEQKTRADALARQLISPCCWTTSVAEHGSGQAPVIEGEIQQAILEGKSDDEILDGYVAEFGERILAEPRPQGFNRLAYWMPVVAVGLGLVMILAFRFRNRAAAERRAREAPPVDPDLARVYDELEKLDG